MSGAVLQAGAMALFLVLGVVRPRVADQRLMNRDLLLNLANGALLFVVRVTLVAWVAAHSGVGLVDLSWLRVPALQLVAALVVLDFTRYWVHYADHRVPWLWTFHRVHHSAEVMDATTGLRMHVVDFLQLSAIPVVLFSIVFDTAGFSPWVEPAALGVGVFFDAIEHGNVRVDPKGTLFRAWNLLFNSPHFHSWHHTRDGARCDGNYGNTLVIWDRLFGTEVTGPLPPPLFGLERDQALENSLVGWHLLRRRDAPSGGPVAQTN